MDKISKETRSRNMSAIKGKNTTPEITVRKILYSMGYRYRLNVKDLPGKPDIVLKKHNTVIFIHGCFWHQHKGCKYATTPKSNQVFWKEKLMRNAERDENNINKLKLLGYNILIIWECEVWDKSTKEIKFNSIKNKLDSVLN